MTTAMKNGLVLAKLLVIAVLVNFAYCELIQQPPHDIGLVENDDPQALPLILVADTLYDKRNNVNKFKNLMINKDNPNSFLEEDGQRDEQIYYIPRVASGGNGKRGAVLSWAIPQNRVRLGNSNYRQTSSYGFNSRPAA